MNIKKAVVGRNNVKNCYAERALLSPIGRSVDILGIRHPSRHNHSYDLKREDVICLCKKFVGDAYP